MNKESIPQSSRVVCKRKSPMSMYFVEGSLSFIKPELVKEANLEYPVMINIEPSLRCNSNCIMCPRTKANRPIGDMDFKFYEKFIRQVAEFGPIKIINFHKDGEPLMNERLEDMINLAKKLKACEFTHFNTNALSLDRERTKKLLNSGIDDITMSVDAVTEDTFKKVKNVESLEKVEKNINGLLSLRKNLKIPWVRVKMCAMNETEKEVDAFIKRWESIADEVQIQTIHNYGGAIEQEARISPEMRYPCQFLWSSITVDWDGLVSLCSVDYQRAEFIADLNTQSVRQAFLCEEYKFFRSQHIQGNYNCHKMCANCNAWQAGPDMTDWYKSKQL